MKIRLGYVAVPVALNITSSSIVTYKHYQKLGKKRGDEKLDKVILSNFSDLKEILKYNIKNDVTFFRMTSNLIPLVTHPNINFEVWEHYKKEWLEIGRIVKNHNIRLDMHPDQFCVLNSVHENVVTSSINLLEFYQKMYEAMKIDSILVLHIGGKIGGKREGMKRFIENFKKLNPSLQNMIAIENDDKVYNIRNTLKICEKLKIPMVLDYHHFLCNRNQEKIEDYIERIFATWKNRKENPKIHFSSPKNKKEKRSHHDYIEYDKFLEFLDRVSFTNQDFDVMIEAKMKEEALFRLIRQIKYEKNYFFENNTTFYI